MRNASKIAEGGVARALPMTFFYNKQEKRMSTNMKSFIRNLKGDGGFSEHNEWKILKLTAGRIGKQLGENVLKVREKNQGLLKNIKRLRFVSFVSQNDMPRAQNNLMQLKQKRSMRILNATLKNLVEVCDTLLSEAYLFFLNGLNCSCTDNFSNLFQSVV